MLTSCKSFPCFWYVTPSRLVVADVSEECTDSIFIQDKGPLKTWTFIRIAVIKPNRKLFALPSCLGLQQFKTVYIEHLNGKKSAAVHGVNGSVKWHISEPLPTTCHPRNAFQQDWTQYQQQPCHQPNACLLHPSYKSVITQSRVHYHKNNKWHIKTIHILDL